MKKSELLWICSLLLLDDMARSILHFSVLKASKSILSVDVMIKGCLFWWTNQSRVPSVSHHTRTNNFFLSFNFSFPCFYSSFSAFLQSLLPYQSLFHPLPFPPPPSPLFPFSVLLSLLLPWLPSKHVSDIWVPVQKSSSPKLWGAGLAWHLTWILGGIWNTPRIPLLTHKTYAKICLLVHFPRPTQWPPARAFRTAALWPCGWREALEAGAQGLHSHSQM